MNSQPSADRTHATDPSTDTEIGAETLAIHSQRGARVARFSRVVLGATLVAAVTFGATACSSDDSPSGSTSSSHSATTAASAASGANAAKSALTHLDPKAFAERIAQPGVVVLDVRTPSEFAAGHLTGAKNVDVQAGNFAQQLQSLDKSASYAVYCRSGVRSANAGGQMLSAGFTTVVDLAGGYNAWTASGNPTTTS